MHKIKNNLIKQLIKVLLTVVLISFLTDIFFEVFKITSISMYPALLPEDYIVVLRYKTPEFIPFTDVSIPQFSIINYNTIQIGDIIVFREPLYIKGNRFWGKTILVKRCHGLPGDSIKLDFEYEVGNRIISIPRTRIQSNLKSMTIKVPQKGDTLFFSETSNPFWRDLILNEGHEVDSTEYGQVSVDREILDYYIIDQNYYFVIGDNKKYSMDSRYWGFLAEKNIIGKELIVF